MEENQGDYDDDQEEFGDDDYVQNYFEPGEGDDNDDRGDDDGGGESVNWVYILVAQVSSRWYLWLTGLTDPCYRALPFCHLPTDDPGTFQVLYYGSLLTIMELIISI